MCVEDRRKEGVAERDSANDDANKNENFGVGHHLHSGIVVGCSDVRLLSLPTENRKLTSDPDLELLRQGVRRRWTACRGRRARWKNLGHQSRTGKCECMEEREDGIR